MASGRGAGSQAAGLSAGQCVGGREPGALCAASPVASVGPEPERPCQVLSGRDAWGVYFRNPWVPDSL